ncbi:MAG: PHP domain-containing protein [Oscillospiraceae bacterium]|nr:PHP domain-containing protein [Oscillospiraceae bacterium]
MIEKLVELLNSHEPGERLEALTALARASAQGLIERPSRREYVNNHIHTTYSFSPYSPSKAAYLAWASGLAVAGIMDHDSVGGTEEFIEAGQIIGVPVTVGFECRCSFTSTPFEGRRLNNPDQESVAYMVMHAIPRRMLGEAERFLAPFREKRNIRNRKMVNNLNQLLAPYGLSLDFERDILPLSLHAFGGSVTERHILYALASAFTDNELHRQFLLGQFKSQLIGSIYVDATDELTHISEFIALGEKLGAIPAYAYLGDVGVSTTGDKKPQAFEDSFLEELMAYLKQAGIRAVTYMPARNTADQLRRVMSLCEEYGFLQISGEDINSSTQEFFCKKTEAREFRHLIDSAWALIGNEAAASQDLGMAMFSPKSQAEFPSLGSRIKHFADLGKSSIGKQARGG